MDSRNLPNRKSIRLQSYDYAHPGYYFVTICSYQNECIFGEKRDGIMHRNPFGNLAQDEWHRTESIRDNVKMDAFVVMPSHIHGIIQIIDLVGAYRNTPQIQNRNTSPKQPRNTPQTQNRNTSRYKNDITDVRAYRHTPERYGDGANIGEPKQTHHHHNTTKSQTEFLGNKRANVDSPLRGPSNNLGAIVRGYKSVVTKRINSVRKTPGLSVWQRNYYEHIIRDEEALFRIREYIQNNPRNWEQDNYF